VIRHTLIPVFGLIANLLCMGAYLVLPFLGIGTKLEPFTALGIAAVWAIYGVIHLSIVSRKKGRAVLLASRT
jgi:hypothetical protein